MAIRKPLVTGGDIQIFCAALEGLIARAPSGSLDAVQQVSDAFVFFDEYKAQQTERENLKAPYTGPKCNGNHGGRPCSDPGCWQR